VCRLPDVVVVPIADRAYPPKARSDTRIGGQGDIQLSRY
jgi:hypothetical protein